MKKEPQLEDLFDVFSSTVGKVTPRQKRVYTDGLVLWLGVVQEFELISCAGSVRELRQSRVLNLMGDCVRRDKGSFSNKTGALIQARQELDREVLQTALFSTYRYVSEGKNWNGYRVVGVDGSSVALNQSTPELRRAYPGGRDAKRVSRWPLVHLALMVDLLEGTIVSANLGAKYGKKAVSEQTLSKESFGLLDEETLLIADRNYGTFDIVKSLQKQGAKTLLRLSKPVAKSLAGEQILRDGLDKPVIWKCTAECAAKHGHEAGESVSGRLVVKKIKDKEQKGKDVLAAFFTNLTVGTVDELAHLYTKRWDIETDLRTLKKQLRLKQVQAELPTAVEVEIFCKFLTFNLVRGLVLLATHGTGVEPRDISFTTVVAIIKIQLPSTFNLPDEQKEAALERIYEDIKDARIYKRPGRSFPRHAYARRPSRYKQRSSAL